MNALINRFIVMGCCLLMVAQARATVTNADWSFPVNTSPGPSQPMPADFETYSINDYLGWTEGSSGLSESFVSNPGNTTAFEFSYNGNHASYLNGSTLTLSSTVSGLATGFSLADIQLSYDARWNNANPITETWAYSLNGGTFVDFSINVVAGNSVWLAMTNSLAGLQLQNGDTIVFRDTITGASGVNGNLDFDNIQITSGGIVAVPEPSTVAVMALGLGYATLHYAPVVVQNPVMLFGALHRGVRGFRRSSSARPEPFEDAPVDPGITHEFDSCQASRQPPGTPESQGHACGLAGSMKKVSLTTGRWLRRAAVG